jgi:hypothetical protein
LEAAEDSFVGEAAVAGEVDALGGGNFFAEDVEA